MGHIFISYSHKDKVYVHKLEKALKRKGLEVWVDDRIDYGTRWPKVIQEKLDTCDAFIVVVSENSLESEWVQNEVTRAKRKRKSFFPILLSGDTWLAIETTQYVDVMGGKMPTKKFYEDLKDVIAHPSPPPPTILEKILKSLRFGIRALKDKTKSIKDNMFAWGKRINANIPWKIVLPTILGIIFTAIVFVDLRYNSIPIIVPTSTLTATLTNTPFVLLTSTFISAPSMTATATSIATITFTPTFTLTPTIASTSTPFPETINDNKGVDMVFIPEGEFTIGYDKGIDDEKPQRSRFVDAFYIDKFEVTNKLYAECVKAGDCKRPNNTNSSTRPSYYGNPIYDDYPVIYVDWYMAKTYCEWRGVRLPTEPEWEKAARNTDGRLYPWGNNIDYSFANYSNYVGDTTKVGSYEIGKSKYGVYDMAGNVSEWVSSIFWSYPYQTNLSEDDSDVIRPRVTRGGSWRSGSVAELRTSYRIGYHLYYQGKLVNFDYLGFRCARTINQ